MSQKLSAQRGANHKKIESKSDYTRFDQLNGSHPWMNQVPEGCLLYPARKITNSKVVYFNYDLAKEMELISSDHPHQMNVRLHEKLLDTFSLRIINEYDQEIGAPYPKDSIKPNRYMATRYLQLQHPDKAGRTSGDGRCIWNGVIESRSTIWDVSSRGTGVTALAPGVILAGRPLKSGNTEYGYGCGLADLDELFGAAIMAEIFHRNGISTERVLAILDLGKGLGIGVRAAPNLIRPAHVFGFLKQGKLESLKRALDYHIEREIRNGSLSEVALNSNRYYHLLEVTCDTFARFAAHLDRDYIFAWLDWDGDNVLLNGGIIDYGSVRQFGLRHDQYRYDDVDRFSTTLTEQRTKARQIIQVMAQMTDFVTTGRRQALNAFRKDPILKRFDEEFESHLKARLLYQLGFEEPHCRLLTRKFMRDVDRFFNLHSRLEAVKTKARQKAVADGVNRPAILNMRKATILMKQELLAAQKKIGQVTLPREFYAQILSSTANRKDAKPSVHTLHLIHSWQTAFRRLIARVTTKETYVITLEQMLNRSRLINHENRLTGNALIHVVGELIEMRQKGLPNTDTQKVIDDLIRTQTLSPDLNIEKSTRALKSKKQLLKTFLTVVEGHREDI